MMPPTASQTKNNYYEADLGRIVHDLNREMGNEKIDWDIIEAKAKDLATLVKAVKKEKN